MALYFVFVLCMMMLGEMSHLTSAETHFVEVNGKAKHQLPVTLLSIYHCTNAQFCAWADCGETYSGPLSWPTRNFQVYGIPHDVCSPWHRTLTLPPSQLSLRLSPFDEPEGVGAATARPYIEIFFLPFGGTHNTTTTPIWTPIETNWGYTYWSVRDEMTNSLGS